MVHACSSAKAVLPMQSATRNQTEGDTLMTKTLSFKPKTILPFVFATLAALSGCSNVKFTRQNPQTGETWTVHEHTLSSDTVSYCPPTNSGGSCRIARMLDAPPQVSPARWTQPQQPGQMGWGQPQPGWGQQQPGWQQQPPQQQPGQTGWQQGQAGWVQQPPMQQPPMQQQQQLPPAQQQPPAPQNPWPWPWPPNSPQR
jgi:hypothetical protein